MSPKIQIDFFLHLKRNEYFLLVERCGQTFFILVKSQLGGGDFELNGPKRKFDKVENPDQINPKLKKNRFFDEVENAEKSSTDVGAKRDVIPRSLSQWSQVPFSSFFSVKLFLFLFFFDEVIPFSSFFSGKLFIFIFSLEKSRVCEIPKSKTFF